MSQQNETQTNPFARLWEVASWNVGQGLNDLLGNRPGGDRFYRQRTNPTTGVLEYESAPGQFAAVPDQYKTQAMRETEAAGRRRAEAARVEGKAREYQASERGFQLGVLGKQLEPVIEGQRAQTALGLRQLELTATNSARDYQLRADQLLKDNKRDEALLELEKGKLAIAQQDRADAMQIRRDELAFSREQAARQEELLAKAAKRQAFSDAGRLIASISF